jgi:hypothetical protein
VNRAWVDLAALLLSMTGVPSRAIPPLPPDHVRVLRVLDGTTLVVARYAAPFKVLRLACILSLPSEGTRCAEPASA